jgi:hypothetical protein
MSWEKQFFKKNFIWLLKGFLKGFYMAFYWLLKESIPA